jgi:hypothetical protein
MRLSLFAFHQFFLDSTRKKREDAADCRLPTADKRRSVAAKADDVECNYYLCSLWIKK